MSVFPQRFPSKPRGDVPRLIEDGATLRFAQCNDSIEGANFRGGLRFQENLRWPQTFFRGMDHLMFMRNPEDNQISFGLHERLEQYRVIYYPRNYFLNLVDYGITPNRGIVLNLVLLTLIRPNTTERVWAGLTRSGQDLWVTDVCCAGCDMSYQTWLRHVPLEFFRSGVEACERWLFGMKEGDEMVAEI